jgi:hypothetical protein
MDRDIANSQSIKTLATGAVGVAVALFVGVEIGGAAYKLVVLGLLALTGLWLVFFTGQYFWIITIASAYLAGTFPILGGSFTPFQMLMAIGVGKFLIEDIVLKRKRIQKGPRFDRLMIAGFMGVVTLHALHDRFGMRFLGSTVWGGRNYVNIYLALAAFFVIQTISIDQRIWQKIPLFSFAVSFFDLFIALLTTAVPKLIYVIYPFYSAVSRTGIEELTSQSITADTTRLGAVGNFGVLVVAFVFASIRWQQLVDPARLARSLALLVGWVTVLLSSFRSSVISGLAVMLVAAVRDLRLKALFVLPPLVALALFGLSFINSDIIELPKPVQRSLAFVPGKWDAAAERDAANSNQWRSEIWDIWLHNYFPVHPWLGRGYGFKSEWAQNSLISHSFDDYRMMIEVGNIHNGLYSALDNVGIIGTIFFFIWSVGQFVRIIKLPFNQRAPGNTVLWFTALGIGASILCYWGGAQTSGDFIAHQFVAVSVLLRLRDVVVPAKESRERVATRTTPAPRMSELQPASGTRSALFYGDR